MIVIKKALLLLLLLLLLFSQHGIVTEEKEVPAISQRIEIQIVRREHFKPRFIKPKEEKKEEKKPDLNNFFSVYFNAQLSTCTDGAKSSYGSTSHSSGTAFCDSGRYLDASKVPYIVAPQGSGDLKRLAILVDLKTGKMVYAVVGDYAGRGKNNNYREASLKALWDLGYPKANGNNAPSGNFATIIIKESSIKFNDVKNVQSIVSDFLLENNIKEENIVEWLKEKR